ncbi:DeoR family transcriptional regulator [Candidatus Dojkabacteria bacterium]|uniref:DeoR family transcriptional regulator n=1 Tax=Candidatus Dojkabacteria bacterium TaxID=2099670 RepID=A0A955RK63_9BACT|nr:DeoR family transcriptional regulator [Candidatus Dojkabacteria bacterium]
MRPINYQLTNTIINRLIEVEVTVTELRCLDIPKDIFRHYTKQQFTQNVFHIAHMVGQNLTLKETEKFIQGKLEHDGREEYTLLQNYKNALDYVRSNDGNAYLDINAELMIHVNKLLIHQWKEEWEARIRTSGEINTAFDTWVQLCDTSLDAMTITKELTNTFDWYKNNITRIHFLIRLPIMLYRLLQIQPFSHLNKFTFIATMDFLMQKHEYLQNSFLCTAKIFDRNSDAYLGLWKEAIESPSGNITSWIERFLLDLATELKELKQEIVREIANEDKNNNQPFLDLNKRQLKILRYLQSIPSVKREDYVQMFDVSTMTAFRDLNELVKRKVIKVDGKGRATKYVLANR